MSASRQQDPQVTATFVRVDLILRYLRLRDTSRALVTLRDAIDARLLAVEWEGHGIWTQLHPDEQRRADAAEVAS